MPSQVGILIEQAGGRLFAGQEMVSIRDEVIATLSSDVHHNEWELISALESEWLVLSVRKGKEWTRIALAPKAEDGCLCLADGKPGTLYKEVAGLRLYCRQTPLATDGKGGWDYEAAPVESTTKGYLRATNGSQLRLQEAKPTETPSP